MLALKPPKTCYGLQTQQYIPLFPLSEISKGISLALNATGQLFASALFGIAKRLKTYIATAEQGVPRRD
jgi:hypothetical protein